MSAKISIHALREEGDYEKLKSQYRIMHISIHALREEGDQNRRQLPCTNRYFYPRPPRGGRPRPRRRCLRRQHFYPRPPRGGRQGLRCPVRGSNNISIHALREEGDCRPLVWGRLQRNFYPRPPRGGRQPGIQRRMAVNEFLSTPSARRATAKVHKTGRSFTREYDRFAKIMIKSYILLQDYPYEGKSFCVFWCEAFRKFMCTSTSHL